MNCRPFSSDSKIRIYQPICIKESQIKILFSYFLKKNSDYWLNESAMTIHSLANSKKQFSIIMVILLFSAGLFFLNSLTKSTVSAADLPPQPYFTSPANDEFMGTMDPAYVKVYGDQVEVRVTDLGEEEDIIQTMFEFSEDGLIWNLIGVDENPGLEGIQFTGNNGESSTNAWGGTGWNIKWDTSALPEGYYILKATMIDGGGLMGTTEINVHLDPTPPFLNLDSKPSIAEGVLGPVGGNVRFNATTLDEDPEFFVLDYIDASRSGIDQQGLGDADQENVGTPNTNGTPQTDDDQNNFCGPTSAANALWRLAQNDPALLNNLNGGQFSNATEMAEQLGNDTNTDPVNGTASDDMTSGLRKFLKKRNLDGNYTVKPHIPKQGSRGPFWSEVYNALKQGEAVILLKVKPGADGVVGTADDIGHYETGKDANPLPLGGGGEVSVRDPRGPTDKSGKVKVVPKNNGFEGIWFDEDGDGQQDPGEVWYLLAFWEISPNNDYTWGLQKVEYNHLGEDLDGSNGYGIPVETTQIPDGFYLLRGRIFDATGNVGMNRTTMYINNHAPNPVTLKTLTTSDVTANSVTLSWTKNLDEDFKNYQIYISESPSTPGSNVRNITDWTNTTCTIGNLNNQTTYYATIIVEDLSGLTSNFSEPAIFTTLTSDLNPTPTPPNQPTPTPSPTMTPTPSPEPQTSFPIELVAGIVAIAIILTVIGTIFLYKKRSSTKKSHVPTTPETAPEKTEEPQEKEQVNQSPEENESPD